MERLEIKKVPFMGTELMAARDADGQIWAGVRWMCNGIRLSKAQGKTQVEKINEDKVLSKGVGNFRLPTAGGLQDAYCLKLDFVPLWLAKIAITPTMEQETPELAATLEQYQLRAKDVLAAAFLSNNKEQSKDAITEAKLNNSRARMAAEWRKLAQFNPIPEYQQICAHYASAALAGKEVLPLPETEHTYTAEEVGKMLGVSAWKVGHTANTEGLKTKEYGVEVWDKSKHSSKQVPSWRYNQRGVDRIKEILAK